MASGDPREEYIDVSNNIRHFQTVRFAQLTIFIAINGGLLSILFRDFSLPFSWIFLFMKAVGVLITFLFWVLQERTMHYWRHFLERAAELEKDLGYSQYSTRPRPSIITGTNAMRIFFIAVALFWIVSLCIL